MRRKLVLIFVSVLCWSFMVIKVGGHNPGYEVVAVYGLTPTVDGQINIAEWSDASKALDDNTTFYVKQDGVNLYVGFNVSDSTYDQWDDAAIYIDVDNDGNATLQADDIAFGAFRNGTICEGSVTDGSWTFTTVSGWTAQIHNTSNLWQVEFNITYAKINVVAGIEKTIGAAFLRSNNGMFFSIWPSTGFTYHSPATWGDIISTGYNWIPEFPLAIIMPLFMIATLIAVIVCRRKHSM